MGYLDADSFRVLLESDNVFVTEEELNGLVCRFDRNNDGKVSYAEFISELTPKTSY